MIETVKKIRLESRDPCARFWHQVRVASCVALALLVAGALLHSA